MYAAITELGTCNVWHIATGLSKSFPKMPHLYHHEIIGAVWDGPNEPAEGLHDSLENAITSTLSQDRALLAIGNAHSSVEIWDLATEKLKITCRGPPPDYILSASFTPDSLYIVASGTNIYIWDVKSGTLEATLQGHTAQIKSISFSPDGQNLVSGSDDHTIKIWDFSLRNQENGCTESVQAVAFSEDGKLVVAGSWYS
jgi:WD40 repeat protein